MSSVRLTEVLSGMAKSVARTRMLFARIMTPISRATSSYALHVGTATSRELVFYAKVLAENVHEVYNV